MATKVKPTRLQITGTPQVGDVPMYVNKDTFQWGAGGGGGGGGDIKVIEIRGPGDYASADEARAEYLLGNPVIVMYGGKAFQFTTDTVLYSDIPSVFSSSTISAWMLTLTLSSDAVTGITQQNMTFTKPGVIDDLTSSSTTDALSANQGKVLKTLIDNLTSRGRFLSLWNSATGLAVSTPQSLPYTYQTGDYFIVGVVSSADPAVNYRPDGNSYTGTASTVLETEEVEVGDTYAYDGTNRLLQNNHGKTVVLTAGNGIDINNNVISTASIYGESTTAAATVQKEVTIPSIKTLEVGQVIIVKPTVTSTVAASTLKLNDFPAYKMLYNAAEITTSSDSIVWAANIPSMFYLDEVSGTRYWRFLGHGLDSNTTYTLNQLLDAGRYEAGVGTYAITRYSLCMMKADGTWEKITATNANYSTATTKNVNTNGFVLNQIKYYNTTTAVAGGAFVGTNTFVSQAATLTLSYSFNCGTAPGWSVGDPIYIVGTIGADGLFYLDTTARWSTTLPSTNDGKLYIRIGTALAADNSTASFLANRPIFYYDNGIKVYQQADNKADLSYVDTELATKQDELVSAVNIRTINGTSILGSGDITTPTGIPSQTGEAGKFLTTDGTSVSWGTVQSGGIQNDTTGTTTTVAKIRAGTEAEYNALGTYDSSTIYHVY